MSACEPGVSVPTSRSSPRISPGRELAARTTSRSGMPRWRSLLMQVGRSYAGPFTLSWCRSVEITSGRRPVDITASAVSNENEPVPCPTSMITPESHARCAWSYSRPSSSTSFIVSPVKQCVRTSPGRINSSTSPISGGPNAMWTISGSSHSSAARRARRSGSRPCSPTVGVPIRTLTPRTMSRFWSTRRRNNPTSRYARFASS